MRCHEFRLRRGGRDGGVPRKRLSYASVVATLALVLAVGGGTAWATNYIIISTHQIKPSVLKKLHGANGKNGKNGTNGTNGTNGAAGATGPAGAAGAQGTQGPAGPLTTTLPNGQTLRGWFNFDTVAASAGQINGGSITFGFSLATAPAVRIIPVGGATTAQCAGSVAEPSAAAGYLCIYESTIGNVASVDLCSSSACSGSPSADPFGAEVFVHATSTGRFYLDGTWALTAA